MPATATGKGGDFVFFQVGGHFFIGHVFITQLFDQVQQFLFAGADLSFARLPSHGNLLDQLRQILKNFFQGLGVFFMGGRHARLAFGRLVEKILNGRRQVVKERFQVRRNVAGLLGAAALAAGLLLPFVLCRLVLVVILVITQVF